MQLKVQVYSQLNGLNFLPVAPLDLFASPFPSFGFGSVAGVLAGALTGGLLAAGASTGAGGGGSGGVSERVGEAGGSSWCSLVCVTSTFADKIFAMSSLSPVALLSEKTRKMI